jgi:hypothetical protein
MTHNPHATLKGAEVGDRRNVHQRGIHYQSQFARRRCVYIGDLLYAIEQGQRYLPVESERLALEFTRGRLFFRFWKE